MYLQLNGGYIEVPSMTFDKVEIDCLINSSNSSKYYIDGRNGVNIADWFAYQGSFSFGTGGGLTAFINGTEFPDASLYDDAVPKDEQVLLGFAHETVGNNIVGFFNLFAHNSGDSGFMSGEVYDIKIYLDGAIVAHYDMQGTLQDQSGNGNHATLIGGTWVDEGGGGTLVTHDYDTLTQIYADRTYTADTLAQIYEQQSSEYDTVQTLFNNISQTFDTRIEQYEQQTAAYDTQQSLYEVITSLYDTYQEIYSDSIVRTHNYDLSFLIYAERQTELETKQAYYKEITTDYDLKQAIYEMQTTEGNINLIISAERQSDLTTIQQLYGTMSADYDMRQTFYDEDKALIGTVQLEGNRELNVYLQASKEDTVHLQAKSEKVVNLKGVIQ